MPILPDSDPVFIFTDIEGSTQLWEQHGQAMGAVLHRHDEILSNCLKGHGGRLIKGTGDGLFAIFDGDETSPLECALDMQRQLAAEKWPAIGELRIRVAIHAGPAEHRAGDYYGPVVNRCARLLSTAWGGQIILTPEVTARIPLPNGVTLVDLGVHLLKDLSEPQQIFGLLHADLPIQDFPALRSMSSRPNNLPQQPTPLVGRQEELVEIGLLLSKPACRLLTLVAPGGTGKTRLALQAAAEQIDGFRHGVFFVPLAGVTSADDLPSAVATSLKLSFYGTEDLDSQLLSYLGQKQLLLLLDNFEHLIAGAGTVADILNAAPEVKILVTSRQRLRLQAEWSFDVSGLPVPETENLAAAGAFGAVALFLQSARRLLPGFSPSAEDLRAIVHVCRLVEGMPLAVELAAAWVNLLSCPEIAAEIEQGLDLLENKMPDLPERHHSIRAVFDHSWDLMSETERDVFMKLSVFRGGFTRESAQAVTGANLRTLMSLINKSLIRRDVDSGRYDLHELLRQYGQAKLEQSGQKITIENAYAEYYVHFTADLLDDLKRSRQIQAADQIAIEWDNVARSTVSHLVWDPGNFDAVRHSVEAIYLFTEIKNRQDDMSGILAHVQDHLSPELINESNPGWQMVTLRFLLADDYELRLATVEQILERATARNDLAEMALCYRKQGNCIIELSDDREQASTMFQKAYQLYEELGDDYGRVGSLFGLASAAWNTPDKQIVFLMQALQISEQLNNPLQTIYANEALANEYSYGKGDNNTAEHYLKRAMELAQKIAATHEVISCQVTLGWMATNNGNFDKARSYAQLCIEGNQDLYGDYERWHPYVQMAIVKSVADEDYEEGHRLAQQALERVRSADGFAVSSWGISFPLIGLERYQDAAPYVRRWLVWSAGMRQVGAIASFALILGSTGRHKHCAELLGFCEDNSMAGWKDKWSVTFDVIRKAKAELGQETYQAAFERGKSLTLETVVQDLLDEFGEDD